MSGRIEAFDLRHGCGVTRHLYGEGAIAAGAEELAERLAGKAVFVVSSRPVLDLHAGVMAPLSECAASTTTLEVPDGEAAKTVEHAESLWKSLLAAGGTRDSVVVGFGGGSVTDLAGFVAGTFLRGVDWLAVPTTLLAQVDAAVGGKTGVDLLAAKNAVGLFHHSQAVLADPALLTTLTADLRRAGLVEAVKTAAVADADLFTRIERGLDGLLAGDAERTAAIAAAAARRKARMVESDPGERGQRQLLNLGHTLGHALEAEIGYGKIAHGDAVAHGIQFALELSRAAGGEEAFLRRVEGTLARLRVPALPPLSPARLLDRMGHDKKARADGLGWVLLSGPGEGRFGVRIPVATAATALERFLHRSASGSL